MQNKRSLITATLLCGALFLTPSNLVWAQMVLGSADSARIKQSIKTLKAPSNVQQPSIKTPKQVAPSSPDGADGTYFKDLKQIIIDGMTVYSKADVSGLYSESLNKSIPLTRIIDSEGNKRPTFFSLRSAIGYKPYILQKRC